MKKIACLATYPARRKKLLTMLKSVVFQFDEIRIYFNEYKDDEIDELVSEVINRKQTTKIVVFRHNQYHGNIRDMGKIVVASDIKEQAYIFLLDDDIIYPKDYVSVQISQMSKLKAITTVHGRMIKSKNLTDYFRDTTSFNYRRALDSPVSVHIPGTGTLAFNNLFFNFEQIGIDTLKKYSGMADIYSAIKIRESGLPLVAITRKRYWLKDADPGEDESIYSQTKNDNKHICDILNKFKW